MVAKWGVDHRVPILCADTSLGFGYILGGVTGTDFLVYACGLDMPHAGRGVVALGVSYDPSLDEPAAKTISGERSHNGVKTRAKISLWIRHGEDLFDLRQESVAQLIASESEGVYV